LNLESGILNHAAVSGGAYVKLRPKPAAKTDLSPPWISEVGGPRFVVTGIGSLLATDATERVPPPAGTPTSVSVLIKLNAKRSAAGLTSDIDMGSIDIQDRGSSIQDRLIAA